MQEKGKLPVTVGQRIRKARKEAGLTQAELGTRLGVAYQSIAQWECGCRNHKYESLQNIAKALNVNVLTLLGEKGGQAPPPSIPSPQGRKETPMEKADYEKQRQQIVQDVVKVLKDYGLTYGQAVVTIKDAQDLLFRASLKELV